MRTPPSRLHRAWSALLCVCDTLFGAPEPAGDSPRGGFARYAGLAVVLALIVVARRPDAITRPQFWAEDGNVFFREQLLLGFWPGVATLYNGSTLLAQRTLAALASAAPTVAAPLIYNVGAIVLTGLLSATFVLPHFRHLVRRDGVRAAVCIGVVCMPAGQELLATPTTVGYFFAIWAVFLSVMRAPRTTGGTVLWCVGGMVAIFSTQLTTAAAPLWVLRALRGLDRRDGRDLAFATSQLASLAAIVALAGGMSGIAGLQAEAAKAASETARLQWRPAYLWIAFTALGWVMAACIDAVMMPLAAFEQLRPFGRVAIALPAAVLGVGLALALRDVAPRGRVLVALAIYLMAASLYLVLAGRPVILVMLEGSPGPPPTPFGLLGARHRALPHLAVLLAVAGVVDGARHRRTRVVAATVALAGLLVTWGPQLRVPPFPDLDWPAWAARLDAKRASGSREPLVIPSHPRFFEIRFDAPPPA